MRYLNVLADAQDGMDMDDSSDGVHVADVPAAGVFLTVCCCIFSQNSLPSICLWSLLDRYKRSTNYKMSSAFRVAHPITRQTSSFVLCLQ